jgi:hypothetical protein
MAVVSSLIVLTALALPAQTVLDPPTDTIYHLELNNRPARALYEEIGKVAGIRVRFDPAGIDSPHSFSGNISDVFVEDALNAVARATHTSWKAVNDHDFCDAPEQQSTA